MMKRKQEFLKGVGLGRTSQPDDIPKALIDYKIPIGKPIERRKNSGPIGP